MPLIQSCASVVPLASQADQVSTKSFLPVETKCALYLIRPYKFIYRATIVSPLLDQNEVGSLAGGTYMRFDLDRGKHQIAARGMGKVAVGNFDCEPGNLYFFSVEPIFNANFKIEALTELDGKAMVRSADQAQTLQMQMQ